MKGLKSYDREGEITKGIERSKCKSERFGEASEEVKAIRDHDKERRGLAEHTKKSILDGYNGPVGIFIRCPFFNSPCLIIKVMCVHIKANFKLAQ